MPVQNMSFLKHSVYTHVILQCIGLEDLLSETAMFFKILASIQISGYRTFLYVFPSGSPIPTTTATLAFYI